MNYEIHELSTENADVWIGAIRNEDYDYCYGGTRMVQPEASDEEAKEDLVRLMIEESHLKNCLINKALATGLLDDLASELPPNYLNSKVGGGRCIIRPRSAKVYEVMSDPEHPEFDSVLSEIFRDVGELLNQHKGKIKLTPDFGRFAGLADVLSRFTPHVLGVRCEIGGCGGKASYTVTGILGALEKLNLLQDTKTEVTLIGSDGALGSEIMTFFAEKRPSRLAVADLAYNNGTRPPEELLHLGSKPGQFTNECLQRGGTLVMTTWGEELENSDLDAIPAGSNVILAHNLSVPPNENGCSMMRRLAGEGTLALPGQMLTFGGALTSRLEWFWRQNHPDADFTPKKPLAHEIARRVAVALTGEILDLAEREDLVPFEAMWEYGQVSMN